MRKSLFLTLFAFVMGFLGVHAQNVNINVDNAANVKVATQSGYGRVIDLVDGFNRITDLSASDNPLTIEPANGATIVDVTKNGEKLYPSGDGKYRVAIEAMMLDIVTSGGASSSEVEVSFFNMGDAGSAVVTYGSETAAWSVPFKVAKGTEFTVAPAAGYALTSVSPLNNASVVKNADGTYTYKAEASNTIYVYTEVTGAKITIDMDFADNANFYVGPTADKKLAVYTGKNTIVTDESLQPLYIEPAAGAEIIAVTKNGEEQHWSPFSGCRLVFANGDAFVVTTKGREVNVKFTAPSGQADLDSYTFVSDGKELALSGTEATVKLPLGAIVTATPKGANQLKYIIGGNAAPAEAPSQAFQVNMDDLQVFVYGIKAAGVNIDVDNASRISVKQTNGYGAALTLVDGMNSFPLADIKNSLKIAATEGNAITSVTLNGEVVKAANDGSYLIKATEGCFIEVKTREIPKALPVTLAVVPADLASHLVLTVNDEEELLSTGTETLMVEAESIITVKAERGYRITSLTAGENDVIFDEETDTYTFDVFSACTLAVAMEEIVAREGYSLVTVETDNPTGVSFVEYDEADKFVQNLEPGKVYEVKNGNAVIVRTFSTMLFFKSVTANGKEVAPVPDNEKQFKITINEKTDIMAETYYKALIGTSSTFNSENHSVIGKLYVKDGDKLVTNYTAAVGETITFVCETSAGYELDYIKRTYPESDVHYGMTYTVTDADVESGAFFEGVYKEGGVKSYVVRGNNCFVENPDEGNILAGVVRIYDENNPNGEGLTEVVALEGQEVILLAYARDDYECLHFNLWRNESVILPQRYVVNGEDANGAGVIEVGATFVPKGSGIGSIDADAADMVYDASAGLIKASGRIDVYNASGLLVKTAEGELSTDALASGLYIAVSGNKTVKFVK